MIKVIEIEARNFLTFRELPPTKIDNLGLVFVRGKNLDDLNADSNDAGKTNLFNVISWVLYERLAKAGNRIVGDEVINSVAGEECWARARLEVDGAEYVISRFRGSRGQKNGAVISGALTAAGRRSATNEEIETILGMTYSMFLSSVFWAQGTATRRLTQLTDAEYKALFDELVGTEHFEAKRKKLARKIGEFDEMLQALEITIGRLNGGLAVAFEALENTKPKWPKLDLVFLKECATRLDELGLASSETLSALDTAKRSVSTIEADLVLKRSALDRLERSEKAAQVSVEKKICSLCRQVLESDQAATQLLQEVKRCRHEVANVISEMAVLAGNLAIAKNRRDKLEEKMAKVLIEHRKIKENADGRLPFELKHKYGLSTALALLEEDRKKEADAELTKKLNSLLLDRKRNEIKKTDVQALKSKYEILVRAYGPLGMKSMRLEELTPLLNSKAAEYSDRLSGGMLQVRFSTTTELKTGEVKEKYCVEVQKDAGVNFQLSGGGMTRKADLIAAFALDEVREAMTNKRMLVKVYDEATDGLDAAGEASVVDLLRSRMSGTAFFVSHKSLVGENMFDGIWEVARENNESRLCVVK